MLASSAAPHNRPLRLALTGLVAALIFTVAAIWINGQIQASVLTAQATVIQLAQGGAQTVQQDLRQHMVGNTRDSIAAILNDANDVPGLQRVLVIGPNGHVYLDSANRIKGNTLSTSLPNCVECHQNAQPPTSTTLAYQAGLIRVAAPINNGTECASCHASTNPNLGVVLVDVSMAGLQEQATHNLWVSLAILAGVVLPVGAGLYWLLGRLPLPIVRLPQVSRPTIPVGTLARPQLLWVASSLALFLLVIIGGGAASAQFENNDSSCAACHTQPETTYVARSQSPAVDLASAHTAKQVACIDCHSGVGLAGRAGAITQGAQNMALFVSGHYASPAVLKNGIPDANCLKCHAEVTVENSPANHFHFYLARWQASDPTAAGCTTCHQAHQTGGQPANDFLQQVVTDGVCQECHASVKDAP